MDNENQQLSDIGAIELRAMELKFDGYNYPKIEIILREEFKDNAPRQQTIRTWFMRGGKLYTMYLGYVKEHAEIRKQEALDLFKAHLNTAVKVLIEVASKSNLDTARVQACKEIINRELGEPIKRQQIEEKNPAKELLAGLGLLDQNAEDL